MVIVRVVHGAVSLTGWGWLVVLVLAPTATCCHRFERTSKHHDASQRRVGWAFGYGAGAIDNKHGRYDPTPPPDGRAR